MRVPRGMLSKRRWPKIDYLSDLRDPSLRWPSIIRRTNPAQGQAGGRGGRKKIAAAMKAIAAYRTVGINAEEAGALTALEKLIKEYDVKVPTPDDMVQGNLPISRSTVRSRWSISQE